MSHPQPTLESVMPAAIDRARAWLDASAPGAAGTSKSAAKGTRELAELVRDPKGVAFTMQFVDRVARPEDNATAANALAQMPEGPKFLGPLNKSALQLGGKLGTLFPQIVMPVARMRLRQMVGHLVLDADGKALNKLLDKSAKDDTQLNLNLLGEAVLGHDEAERRAERTLALISNPRVTYVSVKASSLCAQLNPWDLEGSLLRLKDQLRPMYQAAKYNGVFINLDMEEYKDLRLTIRLFTELLSEEEFTHLEAGIVLQAYLPDSFEALQELAAFAAERVSNGGAPIKIRLVKGANLSMEKVESEVHGWPQAPYATKHDVDANYLRLVDWILTPEHAANVRIGIASHNLFTVAAAWELAVARGVEKQVDAEMLQGMSPEQSRLVREAIGRMILYTPVVHAEDFDVAVSYLVRRLEENAEEQNFLHSLFAPGTTPMDRQEEAFKRAVEDRWEVSDRPRRSQDRRVEDAKQAPDTGRFINEPDTDPALRASREWALAALAAEPVTIEQEEITDPALVDAAVATARQLSERWAQKSGAERATVLDTIANELAKARGEFITVMAHEAGKTVDQSDPEISEAIDFATYYGQSARLLDEARSEFTPHAVTVVVPPWNFPVAIPCGGVTSALAAGSAVILSPAPEVVDCAQVLVNAIHRGLDAHGIDRDLVQLLRTDEADAGQRLISHEDVDHIILTGASETAKLFRSWRPEMDISAETSGKNAIIVTPAADPDLAVADIYRSAFGHSGQKCSASSLVILVGAAGQSRRLREQLIDAVSTLRVGPGTDITTTMNGLISPPGEKLQRGLTQLDEGESWLLKPRQLDEEGRFWTPGIRDNVAPGSWFHTHECFGPVLGIMHASTLEEAIEWQNSTGFGLTGGIHSLDPEEVDLWTDRVEVGNAYINRGITGAIVQRQSFGGWKDSVIGAGAKAGGPNYVAQQGVWSDGSLDIAQVQLPSTAADFLRRAAELLSDEDLRWLTTAAELDELAWREEFGATHDLTALRSEANIFRYRPLLDPLRIRVGDNAALRDVLRLQLAALRTGTAVDISARESVARELSQAGIHARAISNDAFAAELTGLTGARVRALGDVSDDLYSAAAESGSVILDAPVIADGRRELLPFLLEQAISQTMHRFGVLGTKKVSLAE
ncbi:bifunctional proline dehydrogenase/L-glutamate gamma-semialdehyde dehydrogenase [Corynebacterium testudinoris]|uniref:L-glutamate gamma-semialdehyde dehydrogenase n=1 Tax=Corynebacterium testudinoris TaxID=136857 RepID=A0A0G3H8W9_9CORY|nr:bifunctional proline dehydrogenase/L-glutamate gamma-semialdehyde dehydrogenase [Corynebacterium testudinoris]AKK09831.1 L-proline dehydrogenase [Corynebacterium testudinoris]MBX8996440.1 bifunctional proline dehydrogenase/L-glutamate gamma-semialdehyde dehydrogenase [Corynebacterium testudinoris]